MCCTTCIVIHTVSQAKGYMTTHESSYTVHVIYIRKSEILASGLFLSHLVFAITEEVSLFLQSKTVILQDAVGQVNWHVDAWRDSAQMRHTICFIKTA